MSLRFREPDVLVLGGGGILGEAWMSGVLAGVAEASGWDPRAAAGFVGTSAGSIVAASLAAGIAPRGEGEEPSDLPAAEAGAAPRRSLFGGWLNAGRAAGTVVGAPVAALGLRTAAPGGAVVRRAVLGRLPTGTRALGGLARQVDATGVGWATGLLVAAVDLATGRRVVFGSADAPDATPGQAVEASCAIPGYFRPVAIGGRRYVDGGAWSPTNMDAADVSRGAEVLCLNPTGAHAASLSGAVGFVSRSATAVEALALRRRGARVRVVVPDRECAALMAGRLMDPGPRTLVSAAAMRQGRTLT